MSMSGDRETPQAQQDTSSPISVSQHSSQTSLNNQRAPSELSDSGTTGNSTISSLTERFYKHLSSFYYDRAKEVAEKQIDPKSPNIHWNGFFQILGTLAGLEKLYMNLSFLAPKGFLRKDYNLRGALDNIKHELAKYSDTDFSTESNELYFVVSLRLDLMAFYEKVSLFGTAKNVEIMDLVSDIDMIAEKFGHQKKIMEDKEQTLSTMLVSVGWETESLLQLLKSHAYMQEWNFFASIIALQEAHNRLGNWSDFLRRIQVAKKSSFMNSGTSPTAVLYNWLLKLKASLISKFSVYFHEILAKNSTPAFELRTLSTKLQTDYYGRISSFLKKTDAHSICLIFDTRDLPFYPNGYQHPARPAETPKGLDTYPAVLAIPSKPMNIWPSVIMLLTDKIDDLNSDKFIGFFDSHVQNTYYLQKMDNRVYMLIVYEAKKSEKDNYVLKFMQEMATDLRCVKVFLGLRNSAK